MSSQPSPPPTHQPSITHTPPPPPPSVTHALVLPHLAEPALLPRHKVRLGQQLLHDVHVVLGMLLRGGEEGETACARACVVCEGWVLASRYMAGGRGACGKVGVEGWAGEEGGRLG